MAAKRSPILGYNHNVKYRGVVFHVQTEDSGLMNPHLFTHLFHEGVIVSTRKLVYDAGSNEESIKSLMQAQHKAVMKDLMKGAFDEKIDQYLGQVEGLTARGGGAMGAAPKLDRAATEQSAAPLEVTSEDLSEPIELPLKKGRVDTNDRTRPIEKLPQPPAPAEEDNAPTLMGSSAAELAAQFQAAEAAKKDAAAAPEQPAVARTSTPLRVSKAGVGVKPTRPQLEIIDDEEGSARHRVPRDTTVEVGDGIPSRTTQDSIPPPTMPVRSGNPASHGAATLPAGKQPTRPPMSAAGAGRPGTGDRRSPDDSDAHERAGQYSVSRKMGDVPMREKTGRIAAINPSTLPQTGPQRSQPGSGPNRAPNIPREPTPQNQVPPTQRPSPGRVQTPPPTPAAALRGTTPQPMRAHVTAPIQNRAPTPAQPAPGSGVVMTRPAVIVGAPPKTASPPQTTTGRVRKAREDEGRGFGQGLISEKSLDEVILAYLSEDAEDK